MRSSSTGSEERSPRTEGESILFSSYADMADEADRYCVELQGWLDTFSSGPKKWPDHNIANKRRRLAWAEKIAELCRRAAQRQGEAA